MRGVTVEDIKGVRHITVPSAYFNCVVFGEHRNAREAARLKDHILRTFGINPKKSVNQSQIGGTVLFTQPISPANDLKSLAQKTAKMWGVNNVAGIQATLKAMQQIQQLHGEVQCF